MRVQLEMSVELGFGFCSVRVSFLIRASGQGGPGPGSASRWEIHARARNPTQITLPNRLKPSRTTRRPSLARALRRRARGARAASYRKTAHTPRTTPEQGL